MHRNGESTAATERMHRDGESRADYASLRRSDGSDRAYASLSLSLSLPPPISPPPLPPSLSLSSLHPFLPPLPLSLSPSLCARSRTARAGQTKHRYGKAMAATSTHRDDKRQHASRRQEQRRLCIATANQRERMHRDGESRADHASLRRSDGSDRAYASRRREQGRL